MADLAFRAPRAWLSAHGAVASDPIVIPDDYIPWIAEADLAVVLEDVRRLIARVGEAAFDRGLVEVLRLHRRRQ